MYGISLFIGGVLETESGILRYSILTPDWGYDIQLKEILSKRFPNTEIVIDNVARMAACAAVLDSYFSSYVDEKKKKTHVSQGIRKPLLFR